MHFVPDTVSGIGNKELNPSLEGLMGTQIFIIKERGTGNVKVMGADMC